MPAKHNDSEKNMTTVILSNDPLVIDQPAAAGIQVSAEPQRRRTMLDLLEEASGKHWHDAADRLARWTEERLVNRTDVYRTYLAMYHRSAGRCFIFTHPYCEGERAPGKLNGEIIAKHYRDKEHSDLIGVHAVSTDNTCKWFLIDIDEHGHVWHSVNEAANKRAAVGWKKRLEQIGFRPLMLDPNGAGGCQLLVCLSEPVSARHVHAFVTGFVQDYASYGLTRLPNVCPNEPEINTYCPLGSWWRLPGLHHTREHWTRVWSGGRWMEHAEAIEVILSVTGDSAELIPGGLDLSRGGSERKHAGGFVQLANFLLKEGFDPQRVEDLAVRWDADQFEPPRKEVHIRQIVRDIVGELTP